jgi:predicted nucleotidyltransferase
MTTTMHAVNFSHPLELISHPLDGRILEVLSGADAGFTGRQVHALLGDHSVRGVQLGLDRLRRQGIVTAEPAGRAVLYRLNTSHLAADHVLRLAHLRHELVRRLRSEFDSWEPHPAAAYLFGSTARRDSMTGSDIDIFIVRPKDVGDPDRADWRERVDSMSRKVTVWTGNDTRILEFAENEVLPLIGRDPVMVSIRDEGVHLAGDDGFLRGQPVEGKG